MNSGSCPEYCVHYGKVNTRDLSDKVSRLIDAGIDIMEEKPDDSIKLFDKALKLDKDNHQCLIQKGIAYDYMGQYEEALECLNKAASAGKDGAVYMEMAHIYRKTNRFQEAIDLLLPVIDRLDSCNAKYMLGECYFLSGQFEKALDYLEYVVKNDTHKDNVDKAGIMICKIYLSYGNTDKVVEYASIVSKDCETEKRNLIQKAYFAGGRMYELLCSLGSMEHIGYQEKYMLLQCALVLKKDSEESIVSIIDDILDSDFCSDNPYERTRLVGLKIKLLFKLLKLEEAYKTFELNREKVIGMAKDIYDCREACFMIAFFLYNLDRDKSISLYEVAIGTAADKFVIDELYNVFATMDIAPFVRAKAIQKSIELMKNGRADNFNRTTVVGDILYEYGDYSQAFELYKRVIDGEKPDTVILYKMAVCLMKQNKFDQALELLIDTLSLTRFIPGVYPGIIKCCLETGRDWMEFFKSVELEKLSFSEMYELAGDLMSAEHYDKAGYLYNYMMEKYKSMDIYSRMMIYHNMVTVHRNLKSYSDAINMIREIPNEYLGEDLSLDLGCIYFDTGDFQKAEEIFKNVKEHSDNPAVYFNMGILSMKHEDYEEALKYFEKSIDVVIDSIKENRGRASCYNRIMLARLYRNSCLCLIKLGRAGEGLLVVEKAVEIDDGSRTVEILSIVRKMLIDNQKDYSVYSEDIDELADSCITIDEDFTEGIKNLLDDILYKVYGQMKCEVVFKSEMNESIGAFIRNERRIYSKYGCQIGRSEGAFQRYVDNMIPSFERNIVSKYCEEVAFTSEAVASTDVMEYTIRLTNLGDKLYKDLEYTGPEEYIYASLVPYYAVIKKLCTSIVYPYYIKNVDNLPVPAEPRDFKDIGVYCYGASEESCYRIDFAYDISCSEYLFEINCHPGLRKRYLNYKKHYMPWSKLLWIISGIKKRWNVVDDARSTGLLLLFYCGYKNYLGIDKKSESKDEVIRLAGDLIRMANERDYYIRSMLKGDWELESLERVGDVISVARRCIDGLLKIK